MFNLRHYLRLDQSTQMALDEIARHTCSTKSALMRRYVQEGAARDVEHFAERAEQVKKLSEVLRSA